uniref:Uncharacterized protein n=1 Tax=Acrobeloides nanus TaxID=290746 RepID=A0A914C7J4_9BILA
MYKVNRLFNVNTSCLDINYNSYIQYLQNTDLDNADRAWFYQTCSEFGFYQTTDNNYDFYGNIIPIDWYVKQCRDVFGSAFDNSTVYSNIAYTNVLFHGQNGYHGPNTMLTYGTADPWHVLGVLSQNGPFPIMMNGTYHCAAMGEMNKTSDPPELWDVKYLIQELILCEFMDNIC